MSGEDGTISDETAAEAQRVKARAAAFPGEVAIQDIADRAIAHGAGDGLTLDEIRELASTAVVRAEEVTGLLRRLNTMLSQAGGR